MNHLTWIEISRSAIEENTKIFREIVGDKVAIAPCVKGNAYGHGIVEVSKILEKTESCMLSVATIQDVEILRNAGINLPILIVGYVQISELEKIVELEAQPFVYNQETVDKLSEVAEKKEKNVKVHIKVDTGMSRQGIVVNEGYAKAVQFIKYTQSSRNIQVEGIATHFANADESENPAFFDAQIEKFTKLTKELEKENINIALLHTSNSPALLLCAQTHFNLVRPGLSLYGYYPSEIVKEKCLEKKIHLKQSLTLKTKIAQIKEIKTGSKVSYGCTFEADKDMKIAILPIGYYDGIDRKLSSNGAVLIKGKRAQIIGRVCMNITIVDITDILGAQLEDEVVLIGKQEDEEITVDEIVDQIDTINYEVITRLCESIPRVIVD